MAANQSGKNCIINWLQLIVFNADINLQSTAKSSLKSQVEAYYSGIVSPKKRCAVCAATEQNIQFSREPIPLGRWFHDPSLSMEIDRRLLFMPKMGSAQERLIEIYKRI